jgi:hypothetical protein
MVERASDGEGSWLSRQSQLAVSALHAFALSPSHAQTNLRAKHTASPAACTRSICTPPVVEPCVYRKHRIPLRGPGFSLQITAAAPTYLSVRPPVRPSLCLWGYGRPDEGHVVVLVRFLPAKKPPSRESGHVYTPTIIRCVFCLPFPDWMWIREVASAPASIIGSTGACLHVNADPDMLAAYQNV